MKHFLFLFLLIYFVRLPLIAQPFENGIDNYDFSNAQLRQNIQQYNQHVNTGRNLVWGTSIGASLELGKNSKGSFRVFISASLLQNFTGSEQYKAFGGLQSELEFFRGGLGSSIHNSESSKFNIEWRNSVQLLLGADNHSGKEIWAKPLMPSIGQSFSGLYNPLDYSISIGTTIINGVNHPRNQQLGFGSLSILPLQFYYYNDGPPFGRLADSYDRYWTGGGGFGFYYVHGSKNVLTDVEVRYDRYTGYQPLLYEMGNTLGIDNLPYKNKEQQHFNKGRFQYRAGLYGFSHVTFSFYQPEATDVQYWIHWIRGLSFHHNTTKRYTTFGFDSNLKNIILE